MAVKASTHFSYRERLLRVLVHIQDHLDGDLSLAELARVGCFSPYHFHRVFRGMTGEPVHAHIKRLRLESAAFKLRRTNRRVTDIALDTGYESIESFARAFRQTFGVSPRRFREAGVSRKNVDGEDDVRASHGPVLFRDIPSRRIAFVRHEGRYRDVAVAFETLAEWAARHRVSYAAPRLLGVAYDDPEVTATDRVRFDAGVCVDDNVTPEGDVGVGVLWGGRHAIVMHEGAYHGLADTYDALFGNWLPTSGEELANAPTVQVYLTNPPSTPEADLRTEIQLPLLG